MLNLWISAQFFVYLSLFRLDAKNCKRINLGGCQAAVYLQRLLQLKYPGHFAAITLSRMEEILHEHSYVAEDYIAGKTSCKLPLGSAHPNLVFSSISLVLKLARILAEVLYYCFAFFIACWQLPHGRLQLQQEFQI